jgi:ATP-binding cassette subfamily B multidrug efflux pump
MLTPILLGVLEFLRRRLKTLYLDIRDALASINAYLAERIDGVVVIQLFGAEQGTHQAFDKRNRKFRDLTSRSNVFDSLMYAVVDGVGSMFVAVILAVGAGILADAVGLGWLGTEARSAGLLVAFIDYMQRLFRPLRDASGKIAVIQRAAASLEKIDELFAGAVPASPGTDALALLDGHIVMKDVWFRYDEAGADVLRGINLEVKPGEVVAIVGATGSGKTTLGRILDKSYEGYRGSIQIDGSELSLIKTADLRRQLAAVRQDIQLFGATVRFNVGLDNPSISNEMQVDASAVVRADDMVERLGWDHLLRERGADLSLGEAQLLTFARAMAHDPVVVIMDEATASIDSLTERRIQEATAAIMTKKTAIVIAHRLSTIKGADRIAVMDHGQIAELGTHEELLIRGGLYARLVAAGESAGERESIKG